MSVLYFPPHQSATKAALSQAAQARDIQVRDFREPEDLVPGPSHAYGGPNFMARLSHYTDLVAVEPRDDWLSTLPWRFTRRDINLMPLSEARTISGRAFVKTPRDKDFEAGIYAAENLPFLVADGDPFLLVSEIVTFTREYRLLILDGEVMTGSRYLSSGRLDVRPLTDDGDEKEVRDFAASLLDSVGDTLPSAVTVDVGWAVHADRGDEGFAVVEANMAWFSNIYGCHPESALDVVMRAAGPGSALSSRDRTFVRTKR